MRAARGPTCFGLENKNFKGYRWLGTITNIVCDLSKWCPSSVSNHDSARTVCSRARSRPTYNEIVGSSLTLRDHENLSLCVSSPSACHPLQIVPPEFEQLIK